MHIHNKYPDGIKIEEEEGTRRFGDGRDTTQTACQSRQRPSLASFHPRSLSDGGINSIGKAQIKTHTQVAISSWWAVGSEDHASQRIVIWNSTVAVS